LRLNEQKGKLVFATSSLSKLKLKLV
jgi:hypothetical protein